MVAPTLSKKERIVSQKLIETLFGGGNSQSMAAFPLRVVYMRRIRLEQQPPVQMLVSVPKKRFKHAVDRNRVKRQIREAFRHHKEVLYAALPSDEQLLIAFLWLSDRHCATQEVEQRIEKLIKRLAEKL